MMEQWRKGADPGEVECVVQYKVCSVLFTMGVQVFL